MAKKLYTGKFPLSPKDPLEFHEMEIDKMKGFKHAKGPKQAFKDGAWDGDENKDAKVDKFYHRFKGSELK